MIYRLDDQIEQALERAYDQDTGELLIPEEEMFQQIENIKADFETLIDNITSEFKNLTAEAESVKAEKMRLAKRQTILEAKAGRTKRLLAYLLHGQKWKNGHHSVSYRKSDELVLDDQFVDWASVNAPGLLKLEPEVRKADVKQAIKNGTVFEYAHLEQKNNIQIK